MGATSSAAQSRGNHVERPVGAKRLMVADQTDWWTASGGQIFETNRTDSSQLVLFFYSSSSSSSFFLVQKVVFRSFCGKKRGGG